MHAGHLLLLPEFHQVSPTPEEMTHLAAFSQLSKIYNVAHPISCWSFSQTALSSDSRLSSRVPLSCADRGYSSTAASSSAQFKMEGREPPSRQEQSEQRRSQYTTDGCLGQCPMCIGHKRKYHEDTCMCGMFGSKFKLKLSWHFHTDGLEINLVKGVFSSAQLNRHLTLNLCLILNKGDATVSRGLSKHQLQA